MSFSIWLKQILFSYGITQRTCAQEIGEHESIISLWAKGRRYPNVIQVSKLAEFLAQYVDIRGYEDERRALIITMVEMISIDIKREEQIHAVL